MNEEKIDEEQEVGEEPKQQKNQRIKKEKISTEIQKSKKDENIVIKEEYSQWNSMSANQKLHALHFENRESVPPIPGKQKKKFDFKEAVGSSKESSSRQDWLINVKDANGRTPTDPDYDPTTLYIPSNAKLTAAKIQYYEWKKKNVRPDYFFSTRRFL